MLLMTIDCSYFTVVVTAIVIIKETVNRKNDKRSVHFFKCGEIQLANISLVIC